LGLSSFAALAFLVLLVGLRQGAAVTEKFFKIYRWNPDVPDQKPYMATYPVNTSQ
jgi:hypothetical protein